MKGARHDKPSRQLPRQPQEREPPQLPRALSPSETLHEAVLMSAQIDMRVAGSRMAQYPSAGEFGAMIEKK